MKKLSFLLLSIFLITGCSENQSIVNFVDEREANEILVFLASHNIEAQKLKSEAVTGATGPANLWNISVNPEKSIQALDFLNKQGLPRKQGTTLLQLFAKAGLMSSDKEENIRYQAGQEEELTNIIRKIEGVLDANVQISFPTQELLPGAAKQKTKAAVYVKHQGVFDDPNNHIETKVKRLLAGSIEDLNLDDVSVILDKSSITNINLSPEIDAISKKARGKEYVSIWSIIMTKNSSNRFRMLFFLLIGLVLLFGGVLAWLTYKYYPILNKQDKK